MGRPIIVPADLDREVRFERKVAAGGFMSAGQSTWEPVGEVEWAQLREDLPSRQEAVSDGVALSRRTARLRLWYRDDITPEMRVVTGSLDQPDDPPPADRRIYEIIAGPVELGRAEGLEMKIEEYSTTGNPL
ncbi:head-tail adaptor protein [Sphingomonadaceae bacterium G21617-S1]|nr:head-tail adaptor protein [Sphingomonadaceae bacterium G21617-S1]